MRVADFNRISRIYEIRASAAKLTRHEIGAVGGIRTLSLLVGNETH